MATYVVKVQFGESLRRLSLGEDVAFSFAHLVGRTRELFQVPANAQLVLTYVDRDGDVVTMAEDQDLQDALVLQSLNPLRVCAAILADAAPAVQATLVEVGRSAAMAQQQQRLQQVQLGQQQLRLLQKQQQQQQLQLQKQVQQRQLQLQQLQQGLQQVWSADDKQPETARGETEPVHYGVVCDDCGVRNIKGPRYKSLKREDFDLCGRCFAKPAVDPNDYMTIRRGRPDRRSMHSSRGCGHGCDSRNPNYRHHRHLSHHHNPNSMYRRGKHGCPMQMGVSGIGNFNGEPVQKGVPAGTEAVHGGVTCDECNVCPIVGPRFKSTKKFNYDLCQVCMQRAGPGVADEYTRIDQPTQHLHQLMGRYHRGFPPHGPYAFFPFTPYGRSRCPRRGAGVMPQEGEREAEASIAAGGVQMGIPVNSTGMVIPMDCAAPGSSARNKNVEVLMVDVVGGSEGGEVPTQEQNGILSLTGTDEVVMAEIDGKDNGNEDSFHSVSSERQKIVVDQTAVQADVTEKSQEDVSSFEGMVAKLASMGFTDDRLNEELLKKNNFDLRMTLDDLCAAEDWDTILEELQEMGFYDSDLNRRLLFQNKGSVKRVVKELVQMAKGEESSSVLKENGKE